MSNPLIICLSGKKQSGKNTAANYIAGTYLMSIRQIKEFRLDDKGVLHCRANGHEFAVKEGEFNKTFKDIKAKMYSFADYLKEFCMDVYGLTYEQCYGTDEQKNSLTTIKWRDMPTYDEKQDTKFREYMNMDPLPEFMTARQVLQYFGTDIVRKMFSDAWVKATINKINKEKPKLAIITDGRFPNEIMGVNNSGGKTLRLSRNVNKDNDQHKSETALDDFPASKYTLLVDNQEMSIGQQCDALKPHIDEWFKEIRG